MSCCPQYFGNAGMRKVFATIKSVEHGNCSYCASSDVDLMAPSKLTDYFEALLEIYEIDAKGKLLAEWLRDDWGMFSLPSMGKPQIEKLLYDIFNEENVIRNKFSPSKLCMTETLERWEKFREELMHQNRFFPDAQIDLDRLSVLLSRLVVESIEVSDTWYRARLQQGDAPFSLKEMGPPPNTTASHGRANPPGIPYLYLGSTPETAIAELRPHTGEKATVANFSVSKGLKFIDLRDPRTQILPFVLEDTNEIALLRGDIGFLERLGEELTRPVLPQGAAIDYLPSQYLCEFVKKSSYDGVIYKSSVSGGINLALFDPGKATAKSVASYLVSNVSVTVVNLK